MMMLFERNNNFVVGYFWARCKEHQQRSCRQERRPIHAAET